MRPPPACYLLAAVAVLADPDLNLATVIKCETARVRGATVVVPPARSTLAVTNTCPKDGVHLCWHNENERIHTYRRRRLTGRKSLLRNQLIGPDWFDDVQSTTSFGSVATYFDRLTTACSEDGIIAGVAVLFAAWRRPVRSA